VPEADFAHLDVLELEHELEFDVVCAFGLLEHLHDDRPALERMRRATRPGGGLVLLIPQHPWLWSETDVLAHHRRRYTRRELVSRVCSAGFEVVFASSFVATLLPAMVVARLAARISARRPDLVGEPEPRGLNRPFQRLLDVERRLIVDRGVSFPAGGSLLLVERLDDVPETR